METASERPTHEIDRAQTYRPNEVCDVARLQSAVMASAIRST